MQLDDLRGIGLFAGTDDDQLLALLAVGTEVRFECGDVLFQENHPAEYWWVLLDGSVDLVRHVGHEETRLGAMDVPGRWAGGFRAWDEHGAYLATGRAATAGRILRVPAAELRALWTTRFPLGIYLIEGVSRSARNYETMARQREALAALGTLAAGLAYELNNPAAAATRAVDALGDAQEGMLSSLRRLAAAQITTDQFSRLDSLRHELGARPTGDPMTLADREDALSDWLADHDVTRDWVLAPVLTGAGADVDWCERVAQALGEDRLEPGLEWVASTLSSTGLLEEVKESTRRISDLVAAVKSYAQLDRASMQRTDLTEGLESTLVMLGQKVRGVTVVRRYGDVPRIDAFAGELNEVWTNLIDNALDAMDGIGTLTLSTHPDEGHVVVEIGDSGPGIPTQVAARAFEAFFTTKDVGRGTGLGLDISRRIVVDGHGGELTFASSDAGTTATVRLPLRA